MLTGKADGSRGSALTKYVKGQLETTESGRVHLQYYVELATKQTHRCLIMCIDNKSDWELCNNKFAAMKYVWKDETSVPNTRFQAGFYAGGSGTSYSAEIQQQIKDSRAIPKPKEKPNSETVRLAAREFLNTHGKSEFIMESQKRVEWISLYQAEIALWEAGVEITKARAQSVLAEKLMKHLHPWQQDMLDIIDGVPNDRAIYIVVDEHGDTGKSTFVRAIKSMHADTCVVVNSGKSADMCEVARQTINRKIVMVDLARTQADGREKKDGGKTDMVAWATLEQMKNGCMIATKYQSRAIFDQVPHLIIMSNWWPKDFRVMSLDRWRVVLVNHMTKRGRFLRLPAGVRKRAAEDPDIEIRQEDFCDYIQGHPKEILTIRDHDDSGTNLGLANMTTPPKREIRTLFRPYH